MGMVGLPPGCAALGARPDPLGGSLERVGWEFWQGRGHAEPARLANHVLPFVALVDNALAVPGRVPVEHVRSSSLVRSSHSGGRSTARLLTFPSKSGKTNLSASQTEGTAARDQMEAWGACRNASTGML